MLPTEQILAFVRVVEAGSFTRAAHVLGLHKAAVSRQVAALEQRLKARLLERSTRSLRLTEIGREVHERCVGILAELEATELVAERSRAEPLGKLRLSCGTEFGMLAVSDWIGAYLHRYPRVDVEADFGNRTVDLIHEGFDLGIRVGTLADSRLAARRLGVLRYALYAAPAYVQRNGMPRDAGELDGHRLLVFTGGQLRRDWRLREPDGRVAASTLAADPMQGARIAVNNTFAVRDAAVGALGIAMLPLLVGDPARARGQLVEVLPQLEKPTASVHAVFPSNRYLSPRVRAFVDLAVELCGRTPGLAP